MSNRHNLDLLEANESAPWIESHGGALTDEAVAVKLALPDLIAAVKAARPMANLPHPVSGDERDQWRVHQEELRASLRPFYGTER